MQNLDVRELRRDGLLTGVAVVARGMQDNPIHIHVFGPDPGLRTHRLARLFRIVLPTIASRGMLLGAFQADTLVGVIGTMAPGKCRPTIRDAVSIVPRLLGMYPPSVTMRVGQWLGAWQHQDLHVLHWHVGPVAVDLALQGRGIGSTMMDVLSSRIDRHPAPAYLETDKPENVRFYRKFGFEICTATAVVGIPNWFMTREWQGSPD